MRSRASLFSLAALLCSSGLANIASAQVVNGDFSAGNTGFSSDYTLIPTDHTISTTPGQYAVTNNLSTAFTNGYPSFGDHTTGSGLMLFADGSSNANARIWYQTVTVTPNTLYTLSAWSATAGGNSPTLNFYSDSTLLGSLAVNAAAGTFQNFTQDFTTGNTTSIVLAIRDANTIGAGNDFVIDDINLVSHAAAATPEPGSVALLLGMGFSGAGIVARRRRARRSL